MYLDLLNNAADSLQQAASFYKKYLENENKYEKEAYSSLKLTILSLQIAVEVFFKKILSEINELLIFDDENTKKLLKEINSKITDKNRYSLNDIIIRKRINVQTISYYKCLEIAKEIFSDIEDGHIENLKELGTIRNQVVHFGIDRQFEYFKIIRVINRTFNFVYEFIYPRYSNVLDGLNLDIPDLIGHGEFCQSESWAIFYEYALVGLDGLIETLHSTFNEKLLANGISFELFPEYNDVDLLTITNIGFFDAEEEYVYLGISIKTIAELDKTYLIINEVNHESKTKWIDSVLGIIDYSESSDKLYICSSPDILISSENKFDYIISNPSKQELKNNKQWIPIYLEEAKSMDYETILESVKNNHKFSKKQVLEKITKIYWQKIKNLFYEDWKDLNNNN